MSDISLEQVQEVHSKLLIIDGHNDTPVERVSRGERPLNWKQRDTAYHTDIPRMMEGGIDHREDFSPNRSISRGSPAGMFVRGCTTRS
jgi:hypothetical protein